VNLLYIISQDKNEHLVNTQEFEGLLALDLFDEKTKSRMKGQGIPTRREWIQGFN